MANRLLCRFVCLAAVGVEVASFSTKMVSPLSMGARMSLGLRSSTERVADTSEDTDDVTCYVVNDQEIVTEGEKPHVVCTSEPDDYAWFNGIDPNTMRETDGASEGTENCVEGESYKGKSEWECE
ncbi:hypothetical protein ACHAWF_001635 [Thalassiosira exigua]